MRKIYYKSPTYAGILFLINSVISASFILAALNSIRGDKVLCFDVFWVYWIIAFVFFVLFMLHFFYIGVFALVALDANEFAIIKTFKTNTKIKYTNISRMEIIDEMRLHLKIVNRPIILIEGYDEVTKKNVAVKIDYRKKLHDILVDHVNDADKKILMSMDRYFDMHP